MCRVAIIVRQTNQTNEGCKLIRSYKNVTKLILKATNNTKSTPISYWLAECNYKEKGRPFHRWLQTWSTKPECYVSKISMLMTSSMKANFCPRVLPLHIGTPLSTTHSPFAADGHPAYSWSCLAILTSSCALPERTQCAISSNPLCTLRWCRNPFICLSTKAW